MAPGVIPPRRCTAVPPRRGHNSEVLHLLTTSPPPVWLQAFAPKSTRARWASNQMWQSIAGGDRPAMCPYQQRDVLTRVITFITQVIYNNPSPPPPPPPPPPPLPSLHRRTTFTQRTLRTNKGESQMLVALVFSPPAGVGSEKRRKRKRRIAPSLGPYCGLPLAGEAW